MSLLVCNVLVTDLVILDNSNQLRHCTHEIDNILSQSGVGAAVPQYLPGPQHKLSDPVEKWSGLLTSSVMTHMLIPFR